MKKSDIHAILGKNFENISRIHQIMVDQNINFDSDQYLFYFNDNEGEDGILHVIQKKLDIGKMLDGVTYSYEASKVPNPNFNPALPEHPINNPKFRLYPLSHSIPYDYIQIIYLYLTKSQYYKIFNAAQNNKNKYVKYIEFAQYVWMGEIKELIINTAFIEDLETYLNTTTDKLFTNFEVKDLFLYIFTKWLIDNYDNYENQYFNLLAAILDTESNYKSINAMINAEILPTVTGNENLTNDIFLDEYTSKTINWWRYGDYGFPISDDYKTDLTTYVTNAKLELSSEIFAPETTEEELFVALLANLKSILGNFEIENTDEFRNTIMQNFTRSVADSCVSQLPQITNYELLNKPMLVISNIELLTFWWNRSNGYSVIIHQDYITDIDNYLLAYKNLYPEGEFAEFNSFQLFTHLVEIAINNKEFVLIPYDGMNDILSTSSIANINNLIATEVLPAVGENEFLANIINGNPEIPEP